jgi:hypothetical protein
MNKLEEIKSIAPCGHVQKARLYRIIDEHQLR